MIRKRHTQSLLSRAMRLKQSGGREDMEDLCRVRFGLQERRREIFCRSLIIAAALLTLVCAAIVLVSMRRA